MNATEFFLILATVYSSRTCSERAANVLSIACLVTALVSMIKANT